MLVVLMTIGVGAAAAEGVGGVEEGEDFVACRWQS